jgi:hypothetical protein
MDYFAGLDISMDETHVCFARVSRIDRKWRESSGSRQPRGGRSAQTADIPGLQNRPEAGVAGGAKIKVSEIGLFWFAACAERGDSPVTSMFQPSGATVVSIDGPRIAALAQFLL